MKLADISGKQHLAPNGLQHRTVCDASKAVVPTAGLSETTSYKLSQNQTVDF